jgi:hypothetical protein
MSCNQILCGGTCHVTSATNCVLSKMTSIIVVIVPSFPIKLQLRKNFMFLMLIVTFSYKSCRYWNFGCNFFLILSDIGYIYKLAIIQQVLHVPYLMMKQKGF